MRFRVLKESVRRNTIVIAVLTGGRLLYSIEQLPGSAERLNPRLTAHYCYWVGTGAFKKNPVMGKPIARSAYFLKQYCVDPLAGHDPSPDATVAEAWQRKNTRWERCEREQEKYFYLA